MNKKNNITKSPFSEMIKKSNARSSKKIYLYLAVFTFVILSVVVGTKLSFFNSSENVMTEHAREYTTSLSISEESISSYYKNVIKVAYREETSLRESYLIQLEADKKEVLSKFSLISSDNETYKSTLEYSSNYGQLFLAVSKVEKLYLIYFDSAYSNSVNVMESSSTKSYEENFIAAKSAYFTAKKELLFMLK